MNNLAKFLFISSRQKPAQSQKNYVRAKTGWPVLFRYFADIEYISLCRMGSKQRNVYYVISSKYVKLCDFKLCF